MNKIFTFAVLTPKDGRIVDARNLYAYTIVGEMEVYEGMTDSEFEKTRKEIDIPNNAIVIASRAV